ncbi:MAG: hypothetical protein INR69_00490 [Mucilaginibacter polytrichastri]|nr:hypothetical protein [Mucilaginibacter polytrichastri]
MNMRYSSTLFTGLCASALLFASCGGSGSSGSTDSTATDSAATTDTTAATAGGLSIEPLTKSTEFPGASLKITDLKASKVSADSVKLDVKYAVSNFKLTQMTMDEHGDMANNSKQGQHIHFILDNKPYQALYKPEKSDTIGVGEHYLMSFLSRSYHESIKEKDAYVLKHFKVDADGKITDLPAPTTPMIFYSRPKGTYEGKDLSYLLLDFYLVNTKLDDGHKVKATINGQSFDIDKWQPYFIRGAKPGDLTVTVELQDKDGKTLSGENTTVERKVTLK